MHPVLAHERQAHILLKARSQGVVRVSDLVVDLGVSSMTVRRDLDVLAGQGMIEKFHGGASLRAPAGTAAVPAAPPGEHREPSQIGIVVPAADYYFPAILTGIRHALDAGAVRRSLIRPPHNAQEEQRVIEELLSADTAGLVLAPSIALERPDPGYAAWLRALPVPVVLIEREVRGGASDASLCAVRADHELGCHKAVAHLRQLGHRGVALVTHGQGQTGTRVINGWRDACRQAGMTGRQSPFPTLGNVTDYWSAAGLDDVLDQLRAAQVTALICHSDELAVPLVHRARLRGWSIPADLSVISYDDESAQMADPPLTAVSPPKSWIGRTAVRTLLELISEGAGSPVRHIVAEPHLVVRNSTAPPRSSGRLR